MKTEVSAVREARARFHATRIRWGFIWALWSAVLAGAWYIPATALWYESPFAHIQADGNAVFLITAAIIAGLNAVTMLLFALLWIGVLGKTADYVRTFRRMRTISSWYLLAAIFGGPMALFGGFLAMGFIGAVFAAIAGLLYPIVGAVLARLWYHEKITLRAAVGIFIIIAAGVTIFAPGIISELTGMGEGAWLGYLGGAMTAVGWGIEGAIAGRVLDVSDPDCGLTIRFTAEVFYWFALILPLIAWYTDFPVWEVIRAALAEPRTVIMLLLAGISFAFAQVTWYKSFPLIGVGRGQAVGDLYGVFTVLFVIVFALDIPEWNFLLGLVLAVVGGFVMYTERDSVLEVIRVLPHQRQPGTDP
jgi:drug/metabolite transporter (DMT)-like permease